MTAVPSLTASESRLPSLSFPQEDVGCLAITKLATVGTVGLDLLRTQEDRGKTRSVRDPARVALLSLLEGRAVVKSSCGVGGASCSSKGDNSKTWKYHASPRSNACRECSLGVPFHSKETED